MSLSGANTGLVSRGEEAEPADNTAKRGRKPYHKPAFRYERVFETMALSCGKVVTTQFQCHFSKKTS